MTAQHSNFAMGKRFYSGPNQITRHRELHFIIYPCQETQHKLIAIVQSKKLELGGVLNPELGEDANGCSCWC